MTSPFIALGIGQALVDVLARNNITEPTPVQAEAIPIVMAGRDLIATAPTGTGKTGAFLLPALERLSAEDKPGRGPRMLVLSPTRELAQQIGKAAKQFGEGIPCAKTVTITGGESYQQQNKVLSRPYNILIATPGRLIDQLGSDRIDLSRVEILVLDEADRMLDIGFTDAVLEIAARLPESRQTLCFTATFSQTVMQLANRLLKSPHRIDVGGATHSSENITQRVVYADHMGHKQQLLEHFLSNEVTTQAIVFTATKRDADQLANSLSEAGHPAIALHGDLSQRERTRSLNRLRSGESRVLVATDVAARGIDVSGISHVINFDLPKFAEDYVHRIGRTGRAGASGTAVSFVGRTDAHVLKRIERFVGNPIEEMKVPGMEAKFGPERGGGRGGPSRGGGGRDGANRGGYRGNRDGQRDSNYGGANRGQAADGHRPGGSNYRGGQAGERPYQQKSDWKPAGDRSAPPRGAPSYGDSRPAAPRFQADREDRQPRFSQDDRQPRFNADREDRQPRFNEDRQPSFNEDRQPRFNDNRPPRADAGRKPGGAPRGDRRPGQAARGPGGAGGSGARGPQGGYGKPPARAGAARRGKQVGVYQPPGQPAARPNDWRNERLADQPRKPTIIKAEKRERAPARPESTWAFTGKTLRLKKSDGTADE